MKDAAGNWIGYGLNDRGPEVAKIQHRLILAYPTNSRAAAHGVIESGVFTEGTRDALIDLMTYVNTNPAVLKQMTGGTTPLRADGVANLAVRKAIKAYIPPILGPKYRIQGVGGDSNAFLNPPQSHSFNKATAQFAAEGVRLTGTMVGEPIIPIGYSMGGKSVRDYLASLPPEWQQFIKVVVCFGDPSMPPEGSLLGNPDGEGISKAPHPVWARNRLFSYSLDGDWYPRARGLLFFLYEVLTRAELTLDFAVWLFTVFPMRAMQELTGQAASDDPLAGVLGPLAGLMTSGPANAIGALLNPLQLLAMLPELIELLFDAIKFIATQAHGMYGDPGHANFDGLTAVDHAVRTIQQQVPGGATLLLFPGTWSMWNQLFQFDVAVRLQ